MLPHTIEAGQYVRITLLKAVWGWAGNERTIVDAAGTIYEGIVGDTDADMFFPLMLDDGSTLRFSIYDAGIAVEVLAL
jgi:hypothetical protein